MRTTIHGSQVLLALAALLLAGCGLESGSRDNGSGKEGRPGGGGDPWSATEGYEEEYDRTWAPELHDRDSDGWARGGGAGGAAPMAGADEAAYETGVACEGEGEAPPDWDPAPQPQGGLEGGEVDDNELWDEYLAYAQGALESRAGQDPMIHWLDVSRRFFVRVTDAAGRTVPNAQVRILEGDRGVAEGLTLSDGRFPFFPGAHAPGAQGPFVLEASLGELSGHADLDEAALTTELVLDGRAPDSGLMLDIAFVIDSTGSMSEEIRRIQDTILEIADELTQSEARPDLRFGLVEYRDRGDEFLTHSVNFTPDVQAFQRAVSKLAAGGGGDLPEDLNAALERTLHRLEWREGRALRLAFVVADAPPHYYEDAAYTYDQALLDASDLGVKLFPVASGGSDGTAEFIFRQLAQFTLGRFVFITEGGGSHHGSGGSDYEVDPNDFRVEALDSLIVRLVSEEMDAWTGAGSEVQ